MLETPVIFKSNNNQLVAVHHHANNSSNLGVVIVVGGPQTKYGSHRQFVELARSLAKNNIHVFRFDYTGAGDSEGDVSSFTEIDADISAALSCFSRQVPQLERITLWGLCDAASAISLYLTTDYHPLISSVILLNPWVRQPSSEAKIYLRSYYINRLMQKSFWTKLLQGKFNFLRSAHDIKSFANEAKSSVEMSFVDQMLAGLSRFKGRINIIQSENDLTGQEFKLLISQNAQWKKLQFSSYTIIDGANHTFSKKEWKKKVEELTVNTVISS